MNFSLGVSQGYISAANLGHPNLDSRISYQDEIHHDQHRVTAALKDAEKMPVSVQENLAALLEDLREKGPVQPGWPNYSRIGKEKHHCHLARKWVACWYCEDKALIIEVYYAGSRENTPY